MAEFHHGVSKRSIRATSRQGPPSGSLPRPIDREPARRGHDTLASARANNRRSLKESQMQSLRPHRRRARHDGRRATGKMSESFPASQQHRQSKSDRYTGIIEVDGPLDQPQSEHSDVEVDVPLWITGDCRYMVKPVEETGRGFSGSPGRRVRDIGRTHFNQYHAIGGESKPGCGEKTVSERSRGLSQRSWRNSRARVASATCGAHKERGRTDFRRPFIRAMVVRDPTQAKAGFSLGKHKRRLAL
jgi:hypothetical protein